MTNAFRTFRGSLLKLAILAALFGPLISMLPRQLAPLSLGLSISLAIFLLPKIITFDFRSDWDYMINLRALPVPPWKIALGQLVTPVLITSTIEMIGLLGMLPFVSVFAAKNLLWIGTLLIPLNTLIFASDNLIFLLFPAPLTPIGRMDFEFFGRSLIEFVVRTIVLTLAIVLGLVIGSFLTSQIHHRGLGFLLGFWLSLAMTIGLIIPGMSWAFQRFETH